MPKSRLESSVEAFRSLTNREIERGRVSGTAAESEFSRIVSDLENA